jgi:aminoglycoside 2'-N-acetyltransferase I
LTPGGLEDDLQAAAPPMPTLHVASSDTLRSPFLNDLRTFLADAFPDNFSDDDWAHALGGVHVWLIDPVGLVSHASLIDRTLHCAGQTLLVGYVEAVATRATHRRRGHATTVMTRIGDLIRERYPLGALSTGAHALYEALGWETWRGPSFVDGPAGHERTPDDDGGIMILRTPRSPQLDLDRPIVCDWRQGDVW